MSSIFPKKTKLYIKIKDLDGAWQQVATGQDNTSAGWVAAERMKVDLDNRLDRRSVSFRSGSARLRRGSTSIRRRDLVEEWASIIGSLVRS
jgi:hypothetical protein